MALTPQNAFRQQLKALREKRGWSQERLAEKVTELGTPMDQRVVSNIESGTRQDISLDEAFVIAAALNVPPPLLWLPLGAEDRVEITAKSKIHPHLALKWFTGRAPLATTAQKAIGVAEWHEAAEPLRLHDQLEEIQNRARKAESAMHTAEFVEDAKALKGARRGFAIALEGIYRHFDAMRAAGLRPPRLSKEWTQLGKQLGLDRKEL
jgi:transcriptional regulator with XRE-family HTH domain